MFVQLSAECETRNKMSPKLIKTWKWNSFLPHTEVPVEVFLGVSVDAWHDLMFQSVQKFKHNCNFKKNNLIFHKHGLASMEGFSLCSRTLRL